jgi:hypothetical protein
VNSLKDVIQLYINFLFNLSQFNFYTVLIELAYKYSYTLLRQTNKKQLIKQQVLKA